MKWAKQGLIFAPDRNYDWMVSHASLPVVDQIANGQLRIYFGTRDGAGRSHTSFIEVDRENPRQVTYVHDSPVLEFGNPGTFDDSGIMPSWLVKHEGRKYLFYIGWNREVTVSYRLAIGLAISEDGGRTFQKVSEGPICDRAVDEPYFNTAPSVMFEDGRWRMWYVSCTGWERIHDWPEPRYHIKYAESADALHWRKTGIVCIDYDAAAHAIGRPCVFKDGDSYKMFYSYRGISDYRSDPSQSYRLGYAESADGLTWKKKEGEVIARSETGWDSEMICYCFRFESAGKTYLFYNGNGFGKTGFGYAALESD